MSSRARADHQWDVHRIMLRRPSFGRSLVVVPNRSIAACQSPLNTTSDLDHLQSSAILNILKSEAGLQMLNDMHVGGVTLPVEQRKPRGCEKTHLAFLNPNSVLPSG